MKNTEDQKTKTCRKCQAVFQGRRCMVCHKRISREYAKNNPDKVAAYRKVHAVEHKADIQAQRKAFREANPEKVRKAKAAYYEANSVAIIARVTRWRKANPNAKRIQSHNYRASKKGRGVLTPGLADRLYVAQGGRCACCGASLAAGFNMDHIMPLALGGLNVDENIQLLTPRCNLQKHAKRPEDFMRQHGRFYDLV